MNCKMIAVNKIKLSFFKKNKFLQEENKWNCEYSIVLPWSTYIYS
jgi:hypothetical protein